MLLTFINNNNINEYYELYLLSRDFSFRMTLISDMTRAIIAMRAKMLITVKAFSRAVRRLHQLGFLKTKTEKTHIY